MSIFVGLSATAWDAAVESAAALGGWDGRGALSSCVNAQRSPLKNLFCLVMDHFRHKPHPLP
jgi:hypothetical protein